MLTIGCHLSAAKGYENMGKEARQIGANTFGFFTRNPRGGKSKALDEEDIKAFLKDWQGGRLVAHAPYTLNPCSANPKVREFAFMAMREDLQRMEYTPDNYYNFHPGSHTGQGEDKGIELIAEVLNSVMWEEQKTVVLLETMAGKGSEIGSSFRELRKIINRVNFKEKIGICMDTCHVSDGDYDIIGSPDKVLEEFDEIIGLKYLKALHLNDSKNPKGAHKDRHERIGKGYLGLDTFKNIINHSVLKPLPMILETPTDLAGYKEEIALLRSMEI